MGKLSGAQRRAAFNCYGRVHACVGFGGKGACCAVLPEVSMLLELAMLAAELASCETLAGAVARDARLAASGATCPFA